MGQRNRLIKNNAKYRKRAELCGGGHDGTVSARVLAQVLDESNCRYCGEFVYHDKRTIEHLTPLTRLGVHSANNLGMACHKCNTYKSCLTEDEFLAVKHDQKILRAKVRTVNMIIDVKNKVLRGINA